MKSHHEHKYGDAYAIIATFVIVASVSLSIMEQNSALLIALVFAMLHYLNVAFIGAFTRSFITSYMVFVGHLLDDLESALEWVTDDKDIKEHLLDGRTATIKEASLLTGWVLLLVGLAIVSSMFYLNGQGLSMWIAIINGMVMMLMGLLHLDGVMSEMTEAYLDTDGVLHTVELGLRDHGSFAVRKI